MVIDQKKTTVAYRCPECGAGVMSVVGLFSLSADMIKLKCSSCGKSDMQVIYRKNENQMRINVPCIFCNKPHTFNVNSSMFFSKDIFLLPCPYSDINIGFVGETNHVKAELARTELELLDMLEENGISDFKDLHGDGEHNHSEKTFEFNKAEKQPGGAFNSTYNALNVWLEDDERKAGDISEIITVSTTDSNNKTVKTYAVVFFEKDLSADAEKGQAWYVNAYASTVSYQFENWYNKQLTDKPLDIDTKGLSDINHIVFAAQ